MGKEPQAAPEGDVSRARGMPVWSRSHFFQGFYPEDFQSGLEKELGPGAEHEAEPLLAGVVHHDLVVVVEGTETGCQLIEVSAEEMGLKLAQGLLDGKGEEDELTGEGEDDSAGEAEGESQSLSWLQFSG